MICAVIREYVLQKMPQLFNMKYISILATFTLNYFGSGAGLFIYGSGSTTLGFLITSTYYGVPPR